MKILVTGICGFAGSEVARSLLGSGIAGEIVGMDNLSRPGTERNRALLREQGIRVVHGDVRCASDFETLEAVDWVVDAAACPSVLAGVDGRSSSRQLCEHNLLGTLNMLEYCRRTGAGFLLISTSRVYSVEALAGLKVETLGDSEIPRFAPTGPFAEGISEHGVTVDFATTAPVSLYGATKLASETLALEYGATFGFPVWIDRCGVLAGAGQFGTAEQGIYSFWIHSWREQRRLRYIGFDGDGAQVRDAFHPRDLAELIGRQLQEPEKAGAPRILNVGGGLENSMSLAQLSAWCENRFGRAQEVASNPTPRPFDVPWLVLDNVEATRVWDWRPRTGLEEICNEIADFAEANPDWLSTCGA